MVRWGFASKPAPIPQQGTGRYICEVFPHPAHVILFGLPRTLKYKRKPGRTPASIAAEFARYQQHLAALGHADPPLAGLEPFTAIACAGRLRGQQLQQLEETLDAITCAYVVYYAWHGTARVRQRVYGSVAEGHILTPAPSSHPPENGGFVGVIYP
jgi:predicted RNase H-like nuclease